MARPSPAPPRPPRQQAKAIVLTNATMSANATYPILRYTLKARAQTFNVTNHPFPSGAVARPDDDVRLAGCAAIAAGVCAPGRFNERSQSQ